MGVRNKFRSLTGNKRAKASGDPDGALATVLVAKRILKELGGKDVYAALDLAVTMSSPRDSARSWWLAHRTVVRSLPDGFMSLSQFIDSPVTSASDADSLLEAAARRLGLEKQAALKGDRP